VTALVWASFDDEGPFLRARTRMIATGQRVIGEWLPYATESLGEGPGTRGIRPAAIVTGVLGGAALLALTAWSAILAYRFDAGGRPAWSWPAFIPAPVEFGALAAAIGGVAMFFRRAGLTRLHHPAFDAPEVALASQGAFVLAIACDAGNEANAVIAQLAQLGATHSRLAS
jgi:hypothetical protein